ncbi:MAG: hypothetical protein ACT4P9_14775 [Betaproteobacteria bacterium]
MTAKSDAVAQELGAFFRYLADRGRTSGVLRTMEQHFSEAVSSGNRKQLLSVHKEMKRRVKETFTSTDLKELAGYLGRELEDCSSKVRAILKRGRIVGENEYQTIHDHVEVLGSAPGGVEAVRQCNELLAAFHKAKKRAL